MHISVYIWHYYMQNIAVATSIFDWGTRVSFVCFFDVCAVFTRFDCKQKDARYLNATNGSPLVKYRAKKKPPREWNCTLNAGRKKNRSKNHHRIIHALTMRLPAPYIYISVDRFPWLDVTCRRGVRCANLCNNDANMYR